MVSTGTIFYFATCLHLKSGLQEVYGGEFPCWGSPHWARELQQQEEGILSEARAWCTQTLFSKATAHPQALPFLSPAWRAANTAKGHGMLPVQIHPGLTWIWSTLLLPWPRDIIKPTFTTLRAAYWDWIITGGTKAFESNTTNLILYVNKLSCQTTPKKPGLTDLNCLLYVFSKLCSVTDFDLL